MSSFTTPFIQFDELVRIASESKTDLAACSCGIAESLGWEKLPVTLHDEQLQTIGSLQADPYLEPSFDEYHPNKTTYWSPDAPMAVRHYPYNRCQVLRCQDCGRLCFGYTEGGGYYVEPRIRAIRHHLLVDAPMSPTNQPSGVSNGAAALTEEESHG